MARADEFLAHAKRPESRRQKLDMNTGPEKGSQAVSSIPELARWGACWGPAQS